MRKIIDTTEKTERDAGHKGRSVGGQQKNQSIMGVDTTAAILLLFALIVGEKELIPVVLRIYNINYNKLPEFL